MSSGRYPGDRYVVIDDKLKILAAIKKVWGARATTVFRDRDTMLAIRSYSKVTRRRT
ncbi:MAG TPA: hypothetical protein VGQ08_18905 [Nitrospiraceae bacterium]|jgi:hypothetical protein|nr:hypothetical protein [Nitrospiraceae bacterium]